jgi:hypothetical protein
MTYAKGPRMICSLGKRASSIGFLDQERNLPATYSIE